MTKTINWGILGPGNIAHQFARGLNVLDDAKLIAVGSRSIERAAEFADEFDIPHKYGSYVELANDQDVDAIYVATLHPFHKENTILCLEAGKAVLCEKPFAINAQQVQEMIKTARQSGKFLMEAMWTRFFPVMVKVRKWLAESVIGEVRMLTADFGFRAGWNAEGRALNPNLAGGGLLDVGVYTISMASMVFGGSPKKISSMAHLGKTGIDEQAAMLLGYDAGQLAVLFCAVRTNTPQNARILGTDGSIYIPNFWHPNSMTLNASGKDAEQIEIPFDGNGYNYEAAEVMRCLREGKVESDIMPLDESLSIIKTMDEIREQWGLKYPME